MARDNEGRKENAAVPDTEVLKKNGGRIGEDATWKGPEGQDLKPGKDADSDPHEGKRPGGSSYPA